MHMQVTEALAHHSATHVFCRSTQLRDFMIPSNTKFLIIVILKAS